MPSPPARPRSVGPRNLSEARETIQRLQRQLAAKNGPPAGNIPPGGKPVPKLPPDPHPVPDRNVPVNPQNAAIDLSGMAPKAFDDFIQRCDNKTLKILLSRECSKPRKLKDDKIVAGLYKELKRRGE
jgi:hypothetical protein